jgi:Ca-activated chloride channel homolog
MKRSVPSVVILTAMFAATPALPQAANSVAVVLDASGSMNARLPDGQTRIDAAKKAVADLVSRMDGNTRLALRAYGHQSPTLKRDCKDTAWLVSVEGQLLQVDLVEGQTHTIEVP